MQYCDGEEEYLSWDEIVPLLPVRESSDRLINKKKAKIGWLRDSTGNLMPWALHPNGGNWDINCCWRDCDEDSNAKMLRCFYCSNVQHEECVPLARPGTHPEHDGEWICCECWDDYILYQPTYSHCS